MDDPDSKAKLIAQEEEIFQTARLVNCGWFGMGMHHLLFIIWILIPHALLIVVFSDYFSTILGLVRDGSSWSLIPFDVSRLSGVHYSLALTHHSLGNAKP